MVFAISASNSTNNSNKTYSTSSVSRSANSNYDAMFAQAFSSNKKSAASTNSNSKSNTNSYVKITKYPDYKVKSGDSFSKIAERFGVEVKSLMAINNLNEKSSLAPGQILKIPDKRTAQNINNLSDISKCVGVSQHFVKSLKKLEDGNNYNENKFHNNIYTDNAGVKTIGIGHRWKNGEATHLSDKGVVTLCANDLLKADENLSVVIGKDAYKKLPTPIKEALLDMVFNKGTGIIQNDKDLLYRLKNPKNGSYEAAINCMTNNRSVATGKEMSGLSKRRLYDISLAIKVYNNKIPQTNINTAQNVYDRGVQLLRKECQENGKNFTSQLNGYNNDVKSYLGNKIKYVTK